MAASRLNFLLFLGLFLGLAMANMQFAAVATHNGTVINGTSITTKHSMAPTSTATELVTATETETTMPTTDVPNPNAGSVSAGDPGFVLLSIAFGAITLGMAMV